MSLDEVLQILDPFLPKALLLPVGLGIVVLLVLASILDVYQDLGLWEAVWHPIWMSAAACWCGGLIIVTLIHRRALRVGRTLLWSGLFLSAAAGAAMEAFWLNAFLYNELGFKQSRVWTAAMKQPEGNTRRVWEWRLEAVKDLTPTPILIELRPSDQCQFDSFWPTSDSPEYRPTITDESEDSLGVARWRIQALRKPARLTFHLRTATIAVPACTFLFSDYLSKSNPKFKELIGADTAVQWPSLTGAKGNEGVDSLIRQTEGAIGYVEYAYARKNHLPYVRLINKSGRPVAPSTESLQAAASNANWSQATDYDLTLTDQFGDASWPITGQLYLGVCRALEPG